MAAQLIVPLGPIKAGLGSSSETDSSAADGSQRERALTHRGQKQSLCNQSRLEHPPPPPPPPVLPPKNVIFFGAFIKGVT